MGANKPGDIEELCAIARPTHALITNIGKAHLEGFGGIDGVIRTKTELYASIEEHGGTLFVNADDPLLMEKSAGLTRMTWTSDGGQDRILPQSAAVVRITYGSSDRCDTQGGLDVTSDGDPTLQCHFRGKSGAPRFHLKTRLIGRYNLPNVLAAVSIGQHFGVPDATIVRGISAYVPSNNRSQLTDTGHNLLVLDAYNANPSSMSAALENFSAMASDRPKLAILGGMKELGAFSTEEHRALVARSRALALETILVGPEFKEAQGTGSRTFTNAEEALAALRAEPITGRLILLKGSRGSKLEVLLPAL
jgi:UDP-N-acetylmuramoyl-tripeptide--D-alanyl-D-alanine ligase